MSKKKGINDNTVIQTVPDLLNRIDQEYEKRKKGLKIQQDAQKTTLAEEIQKEINLIKLTGEAKIVVNDMEADFSTLEIRTKKEAKKKAEKDVIRESEVKAGKKTLREFHEHGKYDRQLAKEVVDKITVELESASRAIRSKNLEILNLEKSLFECQHKIRGLVIQPGFLLLELFKGLMEYGNEQVNMFVTEFPDFNIQVQEVQRKLWLTDGKSLGGGQVWETRTVKEARRIAHDPVLPFDLVPSLLDQLAGFKDDAMVNVHYYFKENEVEARSIRPKQRAISTTPESVKEKKAVTTHSLPAEDRHWDKEKTLKKPSLVTGDVALSEGEEQAKKTAAIMAEKEEDKENG